MLSSSMILIADDDRLVLDLLQRTLALGQLETRVVQTGRQVLEAIEGDLPELLVMDVNMPELSGIEVCRKLRADERTAHVPIILLSAESDQRTVLDGFNGGADDYVTKPFQPEVLLAKVKATLRSRRAVPRSDSILDLAPGTYIENRFMIRSKIGTGAMGVVYRSTDLERRTEVALKIEHRSQSGEQKVAQRFQREIDALSRIDHPNVVQIFQAGYYNGHLYYAMQFIDGPSLRNRLEAQGALSTVEALQTAAAVAAGLAAVHALGWVHRDVKPENILLDSRGAVRIGDFGLVFPMEVDRTRLTMDGGLVGTLLYMSPEQVLAEDTDHRSDIYSLGLVLSEMLTGVPARGRGAPGSIFLGAMTPIPDPRTVGRSIPAAAAEICMRAASPRREDRPQSAQELRDGLLRVASDLAASNERR
jgi:DNA-binding response OmpR family regulator